MALHGVNKLLRNNEQAPQLSIRNKLVGRYSGQQELASSVLFTPVESQFTVYEIKLQL